jgi:hypothetical protein
VGDFIINSCFLLIRGNADAEVNIVWNVYVCRDNQLLNWYINIYCSCTEYTD